MSSSAPPFVPPPHSDLVANNALHRPVPPPVPYLVVSFTGLLVSAVLVFFGQFADVAHAVGWMLAAVVGIGAVALFTAEDFKRKEKSNYSAQPLALKIRTVLAVAALILCGTHAWIIAWSLASR